MSFSALAGGAECGPVNPLAQLSKTFAHDRGVQQDHFGSQAGSSKQSFRHSPLGPSSSSSSSLPSDPTAAQFFQPHPHSQPFDLSPLNRALTPAGQSHSHSNTPPPPQQVVPAWAQAFQSNVPPSAHSAQEQELFSQAFGRSNPQQVVTNGGTPAWAKDFSARAQQQSPSPVQQQPQHGGQHYQPAQTTRLYGQGFGVNGAGIRMGMPIVAGAQNHSPAMMQSRETTKEDQAVDWETAFLAQEASSSTTSASVDTATTSNYLDHVLETRALTPPLRSHTPIDESTARDALARTAAALLSTVQSSEDQRTRTHESTSQADDLQQREIRDKFANSSFMDLMRRLRDGEVAVEGDKVVEQVQPYGSTQQQQGGKGKARADGWVNDFTATTREEEGRVNGSGAPPILGAGIRVEDHARAQHHWAGRQMNPTMVTDGDLRREVERSYDTMSGLWEEEDQVRQQREREKGKGKETAERPLQFQGDGGAMIYDEESPQYDTRVHLAQSSWEEDFDDASMIVGGHALGGGRQTRRKSLSAQQKEWDMLQDSWDEFEVTAAGLKPKDATTQQQQQASTSSTSHGYSFAQNNPYLLHQRENAFASSTHHHSHHSAATASHDAAALSSARIDSLLQHEADVQTDPHNASAWFSLGIKQQENEREELAISALQRAIELDPTVARGAAHLALAISYTNESRRGAAYEQIDKWVDVVARSNENKVYTNEIEQYRNLFGASLPQTSTERHQYLTGLLIRLAQSGTEAMMVEGGVDADVQVAMGVLFNSSEEYEKAGDCFEAALAVRPDDPLLYNRLGATYANSGKTDLAIQYYLAALDLQPGYVRARFNLAVANMNLGNYEEAIQHLLTSLSVQQADSEHEHLLDPTPSNGPSGITSQTLWDSLNVSLIHMVRTDLSGMASEKNLRGLLRELVDSN
ncbi:tetratricopeptide repeat protein [Sporobolomyces salmoneus]|uniref:tetratricopeptide repeat protein n=1 Tax=Sporobolomyces salmoneus TaxID=183962 RepID=UPI00317F4533